MEWRRTTHISQKNLALTHTHIIASQWVSERLRLRLVAMLCIVDSLCVRCCDEMHWIERCWEGDGFDALRRHLNSQFFSLLYFVMYRVVSFRFSSSLYLSQNKCQTTNLWLQLHIEKSIYFCSERIWNCMRLLSCVACMCDACRMALKMILPIGKKIP